MRFELTEALADQIIFAMEDQHRSCLLDSRRSLVVDAAEAYREDLEDAEADRWMPLPEWGPADGFRVMESFAAGLRNPPVRQALTAALDRGRGVFRAFKDVLSSYPEVEKLWFSHKEKELRRRVLTWYNGLREEWGLEAVGDEPEETGDLVLEDFRIRASGSADADAIRALLSSTPSFSPAPASGVPSPFSFVAESSRGDIVACTLACLEGGVARILALEVEASFRGLGLGEELLSRQIDAVFSAGALSLEIDLPSDSGGFDRVLSRRGFSPVMTRFRRSGPQLE